MEYVAVYLQFSPADPFGEILAYHLSESGYEMFEETVNGLTAFIVEDKFSEENLREILDQIRELGCEINWHKEIILPKNWNEEWENNFQPQIISDQIYIRADFHAQNSNYKYEIVVQPKMAFGTGHHATTAQVMEQMLAIDFIGKSVLDMGSGTGILAILAAKMGADTICAVDIDQVCAESSTENALRNGCPEIEVIQGIAENITNRKFHIILANINRNIILNDLPFYSHLMHTAGTLIMSGFYEQDLAAISEKALAAKLQYQHHTVMNDWCCAVFSKQ